MIDFPAENLEAFLRDLTALAKTHGIVISGCGCCGSPALGALRFEGHYIFADHPYAANLVWAPE